MARCRACELDAAETESLDRETLCENLNDRSEFFACRVSGSSVKRRPMRAGELGEKERNSTMTRTLSLTMIALLGLSAVAHGQTSPSSSGCGTETWSTDRMAYVGVPCADGQTPVTQQAAAPLTEEQVIAYAKDRLAPYKAPKTVEFVDQIPRTAATKVNRSAMIAARGG